MPWPGAGGADNGCGDCSEWTSGWNQQRRVFATRPRPPTGAARARCARSPAHAAQRRRLPVHEARRGERVPDCAAMCVIGERRSGASVDQSDEGKRGGCGARRVSLCQPRAPHAFRAGQTVRQCADVGSEEGNVSPEDGSPEEGNSRSSDARCARSVPAEPCIPFLQDLTSVRAYCLRWMMVAEPWAEGRT